MKVRKSLIKARFHARLPQTVIKATNLLERIAVNQQSRSGERLMSECIVLIVKHACGPALVRRSLLSDLYQEKG